MSRDRLCNLRVDDISIKNSYSIYSGVNNSLKIFAYEKTFAKFPFLYDQSLLKGS